MLFQWIGWVSHLSSRAKAHLNVCYCAIQEFCHVLSEALHVVTVNLSKPQGKKLKISVVPNQAFRDAHHIEFGENLVLKLYKASILSVRDQSVLLK